MEIGSTIGLIGGSIGAVYYITKIYEYFSTPREKLSVEVQKVPCKKPESPPSPTDDRMAVMLEAMNSHKSMWILKVRNNGKIRCSETTLVLPNAEICNIYREGKDVELTSLRHGVIQLGDIEPMESINIYAWSSSGHSPGEDVRLRHSKGIGAVRPVVSAPKFTADLGASVVESAKIIFFLGIIVLFAVIVAALTTKEFKLGEKSPDTIQPVNTYSPTSTNKPAL